MGPDFRVFPIIKCCIGVTSMNDSNVEILTAEELAQRLKVKPSWVVEAGRAARNSDPLTTAASWLLHLARRRVEQP
jgi:hypothetical protein